MRCHGTTLVTLLALGLADAVSAQPNIVLLIADDASWETWGFMGDPIIQTPRVDSLAQAGTLYEHGMSTDSICLPALQTLLYGKHPALVEQLYRQLPDPPPPRQQSTVFTTLPDLLRTVGYESFQGGKHWEGTWSQAGFDGGTVEVNQGFPPSFFTFARPSIEPLWQWFDSRTGRAPFFIWFAPMLPHTPIDPAPELVALYENQGLSTDAVQWYAQITRFDNIVGELLDGLEARGHGLHDTVFVFVTDNGWQQEPDENHPVGTLVGGINGKFSIQEEGWRSPFSFTGPGWCRAVYGSDRLVDFHHVFWTILDIAGLPDNEGLSLVDGPPELTRAYGVHDMLRVDAVPWQVPGHAAFIRTERWRFVEREGDPDALYDTQVDPKTTTNLASTYPVVAATLKDDLAQWIVSVPEPHGLVQLGVGVLALCLCSKGRTTTTASARPAGPPAPSSS